VESSSLISLQEMRDRALHRTNEQILSNPHVSALLSVPRLAGVCLGESSQASTVAQNPPAVSRPGGFLFCAPIDKRDKNLHGRKCQMSLRINDIAPDFTAETTQGPIHFHEWIGDGWAVLFSHPKDFTPVCTTELGAVAGLEKQFAERGTKVIGLSVDPVSNHSKWASDIRMSAATL
jgi:hypothetical protein